MANEVSVNCGLVIRKNNGQFQAMPSAYRDDLAGDYFGPTPGAMVVTTYGTDVDLSQLTTPGWCRISNLEDEGGNYFEYGIYDPETLAFYPFGECHPGKPQVFLLSRNFGEQYAGTGTGTTSPTNTFRLKANGGSVNALVEAFER